MFLRRVKKGSVHYSVFLTSLSSGQAGGDLVRLEGYNREESWRFQDNLIVHYPSRKVLTAYKDGSLHLTPKHSISRLSLPDFIFSTTGAVIDRLLTLIDFVKVRSV